MLTLFCSLFWLTNLEHCSGSGSRITCRPSSNRNYWVPLQILIELVMLKRWSRDYSLRQSLDFVPQRWSAGQSFLWVDFMRKLILKFLVFLQWKNTVWEQACAYFNILFKNIPSLGKNASVILFLRKLHNSLAKTVRIKRFGNLEAFGDFQKGNSQSFWCLSFFYLEFCTRYLCGIFLFLLALCSVFRYVLN